MASREAGDGPSNDVFIITDNPDEVDPAGGASRRIGICLDVDVRRGKNCGILSRSFQIEINNFSII
jgi:hypothetical protein